MELQSRDLLNKYAEDGFIRTVAGKVTSDPGKKYAFKGLSGSADIVLAASVFSLHAKTNLVVARDIEEASYLINDLQNLLPETEIFLFPSSYKKPYQFEATDNANVLQRTEVLARLCQKEMPPLFIVAPADALGEKVVRKQRLIETSHVFRVGHQTEQSSLISLLTKHNFERTDFVYEPGQFAVRGGIIDIFSFSEELPFRMEFLGDEIESIRLFNPETQLSEASRNFLTVTPNFAQNVSEEITGALGEFLPADSLLWFKDLKYAKEVTEIYFQKTERAYNELVNAAGGTSVIAKPSLRFQGPEEFDVFVNQFTRIEFGKNSNPDSETVFDFDTTSQPSFHKDFNKLAEDLHQKSESGYVNFIASDMPGQTDKLSTILEDLGVGKVFESLNFSLRKGFIDKRLKLTCYTDHQIFDRYHKYKTKRSFSNSKAVTLRALKAMQVGDYVTHIDYGIGRFAGMEKIDVKGKLQEAVRLIYRDNDILYVSVHALHKISRYSGRDGAPPSMNKLGSQEWENKKTKAKKKVRDIAKGLIDLYAKRRASPGFAFSRDNFMQAELETSFMYEDTPDQAKASEMIKNDLMQPYPADRLVCGDVGFGKTEIAVRAAFKVVYDNKQVAVLVPTTILAMQHFKTFSERLEKFPCRVAYINRFKSTAEIKQTLKETAEGKVDILIGTHRIVSKDIKFKDLGLLIIDEEQKFGVSVKEKLKEMRVNVDTLTLTATPIPRTLQFSLLGARDLSIISTPPPNRRPVTTEVHTFNEEVIRDAISFEIKRGGQVFFVHNRIADIEEVADIILRLVPDARIAVAHGRMKGDQLEKVMVKFIEGEYDILVSTNIIESGLDIANANTIIINRAHMFGLSDLHQMRGRVGRSNRGAFCYLLTPPISGLPADASKRLRTLEEFSDLGDGFRVAMRDLDIRGAGNLLGGEQSGFINDLGFDTYHKILDETVAELKESEFKDLFQPNIDLKALVKDCIIETDLEIVIPESYVTDVSERLKLYTELDNAKNEEEAQKFADALRDRFGKLPEQTEELIKTVRLRRLAELIGIEKLTIKSGRLKAFFSKAADENYFNSEIFTGVLNYVQTHPQQCKLTQRKDQPVLEIDNIAAVADAVGSLSIIYDKVP